MDSSEVGNKFTCHGKTNHRFTAIRFQTGVSTIARFHKGYMPLNITLMKQVLTLLVNYRLTLTLA